MTQKVHPSFDRDVRNRELAAAIAYAGASGGGGWISKVGTRLVEDSEGDLPSGDLGTFDNTGTSGLDATIGAGEAVVDGGYLATDESFTVSLDPSTANQTVYIGWRDSAADTIIVGLDSAFSANDHRIAAWEFDTDGSVVTATRDVRDLGQTISTATLEADDVSFNDSITGPEENTVTSLRNPIRVTEEASTFTENNITLTNNNTSVQNGSVELGGVSSTAIRPDDNDSFPTSQSQGVVINPNTAVTEITVEISSNTSGVQDVSVTDSNGDNILAQKTQGYTAGDTVTFNVSLSSGTDYNLVCSNDGSNFTSGNRNNTSPPFTSTNVDIIKQSAGALPSEDGPFFTTDNMTSIKSVEAISGDVTTGDVLVSFDSGSEDIEQYDLATLQRSLDGETVTIDIEDSTGTVLKSDISPNTDISDITSSKDVRFRANLSRNNTSNNPTVDYLARRFIR